MNIINLKVGILTFLFILSVFMATGQNTPALILKIKQSRQDTNRVKLLLSLSRQILFKSGLTPKDIDSSFRFMKEAEALSVQLNDSKSKGNTYLMAALIFNKKGDKSQGLVFSEKALSLFKQVNDVTNIANAYIIIGQHYGDEGKELKVKIDYYKKAIAIFHKAGAKEREATTLVDLADLEMITSNREDAKKHLLTALSIYKSINYKELQGLYNILGSMGDPADNLGYELLALKTAEIQKDTTLQVSTIYNRMGLAYYKLKKWPQAAEAFHNGALIAAKFHDTNSLAILTANQAMTLSKDGHVLESISALKKIESLDFFKTNAEQRTNLNTGFLDNYLVLKRYAEAKIYFEKLLADQRTSEEPSSTNIIRAIIRYYIETGQYRLVYPYLKKNQEITEKAHLIQTLSLNQLWWFKADSALGRYHSSISHYQQYKKLDDSVFSLAKNKQVAIIENKFQTEKKDKDLLLKSKNIALLNQQALLDQNQLQKGQVVRNYLLGGAILLLLFLGVGYYRYRLKQSSNLQMQIKQEEINTQNAMLQNLVVEKDWLLKEVHHRVKNNLQIVMSLLSSQSAYLENSAAIDAIRESRNRVQAISLIHQKLYKSNFLASINMAAYVTDLIESLADSFDTRKRRIRFEQLIEPVNLDLAQAVPLGLILNESITNAIKYAFGADGGQVTVTLRLINDETLLLTISDDGKGFPPDMELEHTKTLGMEMMKALSSQLAGVFKIENMGGVRVSIQFSIEKSSPGLSAPFSIS